MAGISARRSLAILPNAALAGIVANAVLGLVDIQAFRELWLMRRSEFWITGACLLSVLAVGPLRAVLFAFLLSTIDVIRRESRPETSALLEASDGSRADQSFRSWLEKYGLMELIDEKRFFPTNRHAAAAFRQEPAQVGRYET